MRTSTDKNVSFLLHNRLLSHLLFKVEFEGGYADGLIVRIVVLVEVRVF